jgi:hypothetical protein
MQYKPADNNSALHFQSTRLGEYQRCKQCSSQSQKEFNGELAIHFIGLKGLEKPIVWVFPKLHVCLSCGSTEFTVPERDLRVLAEGVAVDGALVWRQAAQRSGK